MWNCVEIIYAFLDVYKNLIIENTLQNFNDQCLSKTYIKNNRCDIFQAGENLVMKSGGCRLH